jgi:hypothetical protein
MQDILDQDKGVKLNKEEWWVYQKMTGHASKLDSLLRCQLSKHSFPSMYVTCSLYDWLNFVSFREELQFYESETVVAFNFHASDCLDSFNAVSNAGNPQLSKDKDSRLKKLMHEIREQAIRQFMEVSKIIYAPSIYEIPQTVATSCQPIFSTVYPAWKLFERKLSAEVFAGRSRGNKEYYNRLNDSIYQDFKAAYLNGRPIKITLGAAPLPNGKKVNDMGYCLGHLLGYHGIKKEFIGGLVSDNENSQIKFASQFGLKKFFDVSHIISNLGSSMFNIMIAKLRTLPKPRAVISDTEDSKSNNKEEVATITNLIKCVKRNHVILLKYFLKYIPSPPAHAVNPRAFAGEFKASNFQAFHKYRTQFDKDRLFGSGLYYHYLADKNYYLPTTSSPSSSVASNARHIPSSSAVASSVLVNDITVDDAHESKHENKESAAGGPSFDLDDIENYIKAKKIIHMKLSPINKHRFLNFLRICAQVALKRPYLMSLDIYMLAEETKEKKDKNSWKVAAACLFEPLQFFPVVLAADLFHVLDHWLARVREHGSYLSFVFLDMLEDFQHESKHWSGDNVFSKSEEYLLAELQNARYQEQMWNSLQSDSLVSSLPAANESNNVPFAGQPHAQLKNQTLNYWSGTVKALETAIEVMDFLIEDLKELVCSKLEKLEKLIKDSFPKLRLLSRSGGALINLDLMDYFQGRPTKYLDELIKDNDNIKQEISHFLVKKLKWEYESEEEDRPIIEHALEWPFQFVCNPLAELPLLRSKIAANVGALPITSEKVEGVFATLKKMPAKMTLPVRLRLLKLKNNYKLFTFDLQILRSLQ